MREAIEEFIKGLRESAIDSRKDADQAFENGDLGLAGFHRGQWIANEGTVIALTTILSKCKEEEQ